MTSRPVWSLKQNDYNLQAYKLISYKRGMRWVWHVACMVATLYAYNISVRKPNRKDQFGDLEADENIVLKGALKK
jgi:hypothetical protein